MLSKRGFLTVIGILSLAMFIALPAAWAATTGTIEGTVTDPSGAAVPGASVTVLNAATGYTQTVQSDSTGRFVIADLTPGNYTVTVQKSGFEKIVETNVPVKISEIYTLPVRLVVGSISQTVQVSAYPVKVNTTGMQLGANLTASSVTEYPNINRDWVNLQQTLPGAMGPATRLGVTGNVVSFNGNREQANDYMVNGGDYNDIALNVPQEPPSPDAIASVHIVTSTLNPEYGRNSGAILVADIKSGTNDFHGDAFEYYRDTSLDSRAYFATQPTPFHQNQFGGTLGGPILKKKLFFFFSYQGTRQFAARSQLDGNQNTVSIENTPVFNSSEYNGNWSAQGLGNPARPPAPFAGNSPIAEYGDASSTCPAPSVGGSGPRCAAGTAYSSLFSTGVIPQEDFSSVAKKLMSEFPQTHQANTPAGTYSFPVAGRYSQNQFLGRLDFDLSQNDRMYFYGFWSRAPSDTNMPFLGATLPGFGQTNTETTQQYLFSEHHIFNANMLNTFRISYQRLNYLAAMPQNPVSPSSAGFTGIVPQLTGPNQSLPFIGVLGFFDLGFSYDGPQPRVDDVGELTDNFSYIHGSHSFKWGADIRRTHVFNPFGFINNGLFSFSGGGPFSTGVPGADFELGIPDSYYQSSGNIINARGWEIYSYIQDHWQILPRLTFIYGSGWDIETPLTQLYDHGLAHNAFRPFQQSVVFPTAPQGLVFPGDPGVTSSGYRTHLNNFAPRIGFAWSPAAGWSVRTGWGMYYDNSAEEMVLESLTAPPFSLQDAGATDAPLFGSPAFATPFSTVNSVPVCIYACGTAQQYDQPAGSIPQKYPFTPPAPGSPVNFTFFEPFTLNVTTPNFNTPYVMNYNLTVQKQIGPSMVGTISYVGSQGRRLEAVYEGNPVNSSVCLATSGCNEFNVYLAAPNAGAVKPLNVFGSVGTECTCATSNYNALQISVRKGTSHGLVFTAAYTYGHSLDNSSSLFETGALNPFNSQYTYGNSVFDARQRFVVTYLYRLPSIRRFAALHFLPKVVTNGWEISGVTTFQTGFPVMLTQSLANSLQCNQSFSLYGCYDRPQVVSAPKIFGNPRTSPKHEYFTPGSYAPEPLGVLGNAGRDPFHGPGIDNWDMSIWKDTPIAEGATFRLRMDMFNTFNHAQFANPVSDVSNPRFGQILTTRDNGRILQISGEISF